MGLPLGSVPQMIGIRELSPSGFTGSSNTSSGSTLKANLAPTAERAHVASKSTSPLFIEVEDEDDNPPPTKVKVESET